MGRDSFPGWKLLCFGRLTIDWQARPRGFREAVRLTWETVNAGRLPKCLARRENARKKWRRKVTPEAGRSGESLGVLEDVPPIVES
jgi:hypothetical protein